MTKKLEGAGLRGQVAGETSLSTVGQVEGLAYRGHKIELLAEKSCFEEVAYLLLYDKLPNQKELDDYKQLLKNQRDLPDSLKQCYAHRHLNVRKPRARRRFFKSIELN